MSHRSDEQIIEEIEKVRGKNNKLWMKLLKIAMSNDPSSTKDTLKKIRKNDLKISDLSWELADEPLD